jgi:hypothetical protein
MNDEARQHLINFGVSMVVIVILLAFNAPSIHRAVSLRQNGVAVEGQIYRVYMNTQRLLGVAVNYYFEDDSFVYRLHRRTISERRPGMRAGDSITLYVDPNNFDRVSTGSISWLGFVSIGLAIVGVGLAIKEFVQFLILLRQ